MVAQGPAGMQADGSGGGLLAFEDVAHTYLGGSRRTDVLRQISFAATPGQVVCVVGPSGCGKSTLLGFAAGLQRPTGGRVCWDGREVRLGPTDHLSMAFQQPGLFPWMTVRRNVAVGLETRGHKRRAALEVADAFLATVGLSEFRDAYPSQLSGGMAQRVGIARALALRPRLLLLDEPFAAVDAFTRIKLQRELKALLLHGRPTVLFVTHDVSEAILIGDVVVVLTNRPAVVHSVILVAPEDRNRASAAYGRKLSAVLECLGVTPSDEA